jgi:two-component system, sensor histidine kinase
MTDTAADLTTFFEVSLDMLCIRDMALKFVRVNQAWSDVLGYAREELVGASMLDFIHPDDIRDTCGHMDRMRTEHEVWGYINRYRRRDGQYRFLEWRARREGDLVFGVARDVTERLAIEAEIKEAKLAAEAANKAKSDFLANMSHEIRTPLNGVIGVVEALRRTELTAAQGEMVELIRSSGATLERLVSDILDVSKIEAGRLELENGLFDLRVELTGLLDMNQLRAQEKGLGFRVEFDEHARGAFHGDATRIKQVLGNLISNAVKFTQAGEVQVRVGAAGPEAGACALTFEVQDSGVGFSPEFGRALFTRFSQADSTITRRFGGTGLGLSICRSLVEMMDGTISAHSEPGKGSLFRFTLPLRRDVDLALYDADRASESAARQEPDLDRGDEPPIRVLLAEDHPINQRVIQLILAPYGAAVTTVENGAEALAAYRSGVFDLVLMDMQMPVMDGLAATRAIRLLERCAGVRTPIIMLSANAMSQHRQDAVAAGADLHLAKPVTAASLINGITEALAGGGAGGGAGEAQAASSSLG